MDADRRELVVGRQASMVRRWTAAVFLSNRGGLFNVWAARFDPVAGQQIGEPFRVTHYDGPGERILQAWL